LQTCGLSPVEVIRTATGAASQAIGRPSDFGTLEPGLSADLLLVEGNAARDVACLASVRRVYLQGRPVAGVDRCASFSD
jgi:imidazolonepropionase-like amidohydrolase